MAIFTFENIGVAFIIYGLVRLGKSVLDVLYRYAIGPAFVKVDFKEKGKWALVTGCTDGIGKQYARQLAAKGCNIVLISRNISKLKLTASDIEKEYNVETKVIQADFTAGEEIYEQIEKEIEGLEIGTLVNNVGISYAYPEYFLDLPEWNTTTTNLLKANVVSMTKMTRIVLPGMVKRQKGVVINISSASSIIPSPLLTVYAGTKAYVDKLSEGLDQEYGKQGILVQCVQPGFVASNMSGIRNGSFFIPTPKDYVQSALSHVGTSKVTYGYFPHSIFVNAINGINEISQSLAVWLVTRAMENSRRKILKKYKKQ